MRRGGDGSRADSRDDGGQPAPARVKALSHETPRSISVERETASCRRRNEPDPSGPRGPCCDKGVSGASAQSRPQTPTTPVRHGWHAARTGVVGDPVSVLDVDTALAELVPVDQRAQARQATAAATVEFTASRLAVSDRRRTIRAAATACSCSTACCCGAPGSRGATRPSCSARATSCGPGNTRATRRRSKSNGRGACSRPRACGGARPPLGRAGGGNGPSSAPSCGPGTGPLAAARDRDGDRAAAPPGRPPVDALLGPGGPLRQGPRRRRAPRSTAHPRGPQPPRGRAPAVRLGRAHATRRGGPAAPLRPALGPLRRAARPRRRARDRSSPSRHSELVFQRWTAPSAR